MTRSDAPTAPVAATILLVDDEASLRHVACRMLRSFGYVVVEAGNAEMARSLLRAVAQPIDLLLTDLHLPDMPGTQLVMIARGLRPGLRVVYITGSGGDPSANHELVGPGEVLLPKPFGMEALRQTVANVLSSPIR